MVTHEKKYPEALAFVRNFVEEQGYAPSLMDFVKAGAASSTSHAAYILESLEHQGLLRLARRENGDRLNRGIVLAPYDTGEDKTWAEVRTLVELVLSFEQGYSYSPSDWVLGGHGEERFLNEMCDRARELKDKL